MSRRPFPPHHPLSRRDFLIQGSRTTAGVLLGGSLLAGSAAGQGPPGAPAATPASNEEIIDRLRTAVERLEGTYPYASALLTRDDGVTISASRNGVTVTRTGPVEGAVLSVFTGSGFREHATSILSREAIDQAVVRLLAESLGPPPKGEAPDPGAPLTHAWTENGTADPGSVPLEERVERVREAYSRLLAADPKLLAASVDVYTVSTTRIFVNRTRRLSQTLGRTGLWSLAVRPGGENSPPGVYWFNRRGVGGLENTILSDADIAHLIERAGRLAGAPAPDPGETIVVTEPDLTGTLAHESFGHGVEVDMFVKGRARAAEYLGKKVGSPLVTILDDPTKAGGFGFYHFDDEGYPAGPTTIVENGVFRSGLTDLLSARLAEHPRTANGRREAYDHKSYARMSNTFFAPGTQSLDELLGGVKQGILVGRLRAGMEDPKGWGIQVVAQYGEEIKNGRLTGRAFSPVTISGYVPDVLASVDGLGSDFQLQSGSCGKGHKEIVPVGMGGPHLRFRARIS